MAIEDVNNPPSNEPQPTDAGNNTAPAPASDPAPGEGAPAAVSNAADAITEAPNANDDLPTDKPVSPNMKALLDTISADTPAPTEDPDKAAQAEAEAAAAAAAAPTDKPGAGEPKTAEQEEAELLEGVKSERGKERIRNMLAERKALENDLREIRELVSSTKMSPDQFSQTLEYGRLINSEQETDLRVALEMVERERAFICQKLGIEQPGIDLLSGHDDLKAAVDNMEMTREHAVELAKHRKRQADEQRVAQESQRIQSDRAQFQETVSKAAQTMEAYLSTRANEADHSAKMQMIAQHFQNPQNLQEFVQTYKPDQWLATIKMMYDNIVVQKQPAAPAPQPMRSRTSQLGNPAPAGASPIDRIAAHMDKLGI